MPAFQPRITESEEHLKSDRPLSNAPRSKQTDEVISLICVRQRGVKRCSVGCRTSASRRIVFVHSQRSGICMK